ncbi:wax ester/triacylglycerol synthase family O-acyltransferase [Marinobacter nanhaiticus D15-8W]|uniref:diacylglycerol O-acyltransferase n=2 Tax=Marinobacter TaxID=2742 RepID=N6X4W9_9GAMM|nr:wax ester/triacylglycerol synthase family O-acyltransferase [Marinobacter nanhaiticus]ENO16118.2 wax ester/triacylglycerol synthase family O-acyltransferase [Marinobacter nanhaiticus D15-8W]
MTRSRTPMTSVDRSWLRMESPESPMMIGVVLVFDEPISLVRLRHVLEERFLHFRRFRQTVTQIGDRTYWQDDPSFDLDNHIQVIALPGKADQDALQNMASDLNSSPLNPYRPLWQIHYVDNYQDGCALIVRIHHCIADGISLVRVLMALTDEAPGRHLHSVPRVEYHKETRWERLRRAARELRHSAATGLEQLWHFRKSVQEKPTYAFKFLRTSGQIGMECAKLALAPSDPPTLLRGSLTGRKRVAWADPLPLKEVKDTARALKGTVNDVLMTAATGAIHQYLIDQNETPPDCGIRVAVPFNLRPLRQPVETLGNQFGLVLVPLPVDVACPRMRFRQVQDHMNRLKRSWQAQVTYSLLDLFGKGPDILERRALNLLSRKASAVLTNVPGPRKHVYLAGARLSQPMFWVPQTGGIGIGLSIFSYADTVQFGIIVDKNLAVDPARVMDAFSQSFADLQSAAGKPGTYPQVERRRAAASL